MGELAAVEVSPGILAWELDRDTSVHLRCPDCTDLLWLDSDDAPTLGDVIRVVGGHRCEAAFSGETGDGDAR